jgi:hypothetical protein
MTYDGGTFMPFHAISYAVNLSFINKNNYFSPKAVKGISTGLLNSIVTEEKPNVFIMTISNTLYLPASIANVADETIIKTSRIIRFCNDATIIPVGVHPPASSRGTYSENFREHLNMLACWPEEDESMLLDENFVCDTDTGFCTYNKNGDTGHQARVIEQVKAYSDEDCPYVKYVPQDGNYADVVKRKKD